MDKDDDLQKIFNDFRPQMTSDSEFIRELESRLEGVELVKRRVSLLRRVNRGAAIWGALAGFAAGILTTIVVPYLSDFLSVFVGKLSYGKEIWMDLAVNSICLLLIPTVSVACTAQVYWALAGEKE